MAKVNCAECGKEIGLTKQCQLADRQYICRDCEKKTIPYFRHLEMTFDEYKAHLKQNEDGQKLYDAYFKKNRKVKKYVAGHVLYDPATALVCVTNKRGGVMGFGGTCFYNVMRVADLDIYEKATKFTKGLENRNVPADNLFLAFRNVSGMSSFLIPANDALVKYVVKEFDQVFNGKGFISRAKANVKKEQDQIMAAAGMAQAFKKAAGGLKNGEADEGVMEGAAQMAANMDNVFYAGRKELIEKADAAIRAVLG